MTTAKKNVKKLFYRGKHDKGGIWQRVFRYISKLYKTYKDWDQTDLLNSKISFVENI